VKSARSAAFRFHKAGNGASRETGKESVMNDPDSTMASYERYRQAQAKINASNKAALFDALDAAKITEVQVDFDGEGDSGQIGSVTASCGEERAALPETTVTIRQSSWRDAEGVATEMKLEEAIETLCYGYLEQEHGGWENNEGGFGEFRFDVAARTIALEFNGRVIDTHTTNHRF
jgi:hypothetical protein